METPRSGLLGSAASLLGSIGSHLELLSALFAEEGKEAGGRLLRALVLLVGALVLAFLGYIFLILGIAFVLAAVFHWSWIWIALGFGGLHLIGAAICVRAMMEYFKSPAFPYFRAEVRKDLNLLQQNLPQNGQNPVA